MLQAFVTAEASRPQCEQGSKIAALAADQGLLQMILFDEPDLAEITSSDFPGERLVTCRNSALAAEAGAQARGPAAVD